MSLNDEKAEHSEEGSIAIQTLGVALLMPCVLRPIPFR
jgi:hypothetical protein